MAILASAWGQTWRQKAPLCTMLGQGRFNAFPIVRLVLARQFVPPQKKTWMFLIKLIVFFFVCKISNYTISFKHS